MILSIVDVLLNTGLADSFVIWIGAVSDTISIRNYLFNMRTEIW